MPTFKFNFNTRYIADLREAVVDRQKQSIDNVHKGKRLGKYLAWDRTCAALNRLEDTVNYLNLIELGNPLYAHSAFDFYDFLNNASVVIDCIKTLGKIFRIDDKFIENIETSASVFRRSTDGKFFEYARSLFSVHPLNTNRQKDFLINDKFHCCPYVTWNDNSIYKSVGTPDLRATVYTSNKDNNIVCLDLYVFQFEQYLKKWIDLIPEIIKAKNEYTDTEYEKLKKEHVKNLDECQNIIKYMEYLKKEYCKRFDYGNDYIFDRFSRAFRTKLSDSRNEGLLLKYKNAISYSLQFAKNELQNMSYYGYENTGIKYPDPQIETTLIDELGTMSAYDGAFSKHSYAIGKLCYLEDDYYRALDKCYARKLLEGPKEIINRYVHFTNEEPDDEVLVLIAVALYFDALSRKSLINKNIPNEEKYRQHILSKEEYNALFIDEAPDKNQLKDSKGFLEILKEYGV